MNARLTLLGYRYSVYTRIALLALAEKGVAHDRVELNPFDTDTPGTGRHPFDRVPVLDHDGFRLYETAAITRYVDSAFDGTGLTPEDPCAVARMAQVIAVIDNYGYWPMVRQVAAHRVFRPHFGEIPEDAEITAGLIASRPILAALEDVAQEGLVLDGTAITLADCHLAPMMGYFVTAPEGLALLRDYPALTRWWRVVGHRSAFAALTEPLSPA